MVVSNPTEHVRHEALALLLADFVEKVGPVERLLQHHTRLDTKLGDDVVCGLFVRCGGECHDRDRGIIVSETIKTLVLR